MNKKLSEEEIIRDLKENPAYEPFFSQYDPNSVDFFIKYYATVKVEMYKNADYYRESYEGFSSYHRDAAEELLWLIQEKKLFNLECQWRAGMVEIPEIQISDDFHYWYNNIKNCHLISPISVDELNLMIEFTEKSEEDLKYPESGGGWVSYELFKSYYQDDNEGQEPPEWYEFYDLCFGTGSLMLLPDIKGEKESIYRRTSFEKAKEERERNQENTDSEPRPVFKPSIYTSDNSYMQAFVTGYQSEEDKKYYKYYRAYHDATCLKYDVEEAINYLSSFAEIIPIEAGNDWREAILDAARKHTNKRIGEYLPLVYEDYLTHLELGLTYEEDTSSIETIKYIKEEILKGRAILGESRDFNY